MEEHRFTASLWRKGHFEDYAEFNCQPKEPGGKNDGVPDGIKVDENGNLFVTGPKGIWVWDANGTHLGSIVVPEQPANLAWGGKDRHMLYITATTSVYRLQTKARGYVPR